MSYKIYAGTQSGVDTWVTKACIYDPGDITDTKKLINPTLTREVGKAGSLEFTLPLGNVAHSALQKLITVVEVQQDGKQIWQGRVMDHDQDFLVRQKIYCEGEMAYLNDSGAAPYSARNVSISQFLEWICDNHNAQVDAYKAFTPGKVEMDIPMIVPYVDGIKVVQVGYSYDSNDGDYIYHWGIVDPVDGKTNIFYEETEINKASCLSWEIGEEHIANGRIISRIGSNNFRVRLFAAYVKGKTYDATVEVKKAEIVCGTCNKNFGTYSIYNIERASESKTFKITEQNGKYSLAINGKTDSRFLFDVKEPTYSFGDGKNFGKTLDILFSHDTHSHLNAFTTVVEDEETDIGGFARANTLIKAQRAKDPDTLVIDGGDFSMGTLIQTVFETQAAELRMLGYMGYDVTTFGNHEFDYRSKGLANMLTSARTSGDAVPSIVVCNVDWDAMEAAGLTEGQQLLKDAFAAYGVQDYTVVQKGDVRIAVVGVFGKDALSCAPTCELKFKDPVQAVKATVAEIKSSENVDMIVCVSHSGTWDDPKKSEDELLAKGVPELDLILSGHTHSRIREPIRHGDTYVVSCGEYGKNLGSLSMAQKADGRWQVTDYQLIPITADIPADANTQEVIDRFMDTVDEDYLAQFGYTKDQVLAENDVVFSNLKDLGKVHTEHNLGDPRGE